ncbi:hypothetical protein Trydic_g4043 [Trypoxylus dichotomus]
MQDEETYNYNDLLEETADFLENERFFETFSKRHAKADILKDPFLLPDINVNDKISLCRGLNSKINIFKSNRDGSACKLPHLINREERRLVNDDEDWSDDVIFKTKDNNETEMNGYGYKRRKLEESVLESLKDYDQPRCYLEGETKSTRHLMLEMNEFYLEMAEQLRYLKGSLLDSARMKTEETESDTASVSSFQSELSKLITSIERDDQKVAENVKILKEIKEERNVIHQEIRSLSGETDTSVTESEDMQIRKRLVSKEVVKIENKKEVDQGEKESGDEKKKSPPYEGKDFVTKNKELAKEYNMTRYCLTDEEKRRLQVLLSDIDVCEENDVETGIQKAKEHEEKLLQMREVKVVAETNTSQENENEDLDDFMNNNGFKLDASDSEILSDLDLKLIDLRKDETSAESHVSMDIENFDDLKEAENQGKHWKFQLLQRRLRHIEKSLAEICSEREKENENEDKVDEKETVKTADIVEEYRQSLCDLSVDIEELEYKASKESELENENENGFLSMLVSLLQS